MLTASYLYSGYSDYFSGHGCNDSESLLYAYYGRNTSLRDIIDQLVEDSWTGPAIEELPSEVTAFDIRNALLNMLNDRGRADYESGAIAECSEDWSIENGLDECPECNADVGDGHWDECPECGYEFNDDDYEDYCESPVFIVVLDYKKDSESGVMIPTNSIPWGTGILKGIGPKDTGN